MINLSFEFYVVCRKCIYDKIQEEELECCPICNTDLGCVPLEKLRYSLTYYSPIPLSLYLLYSHKSYLYLMLVAAFMNQILLTCKVITSSFNLVKCSEGYVLVSSGYWQSLVVYWFIDGSKGNALGLLIFIN